MSLACDKRDFFRTATQGCYHLLPMEVYGQGRSARAMWSAMDALVLKRVALQIDRGLKPVITLKVKFSGKACAKSAMLCIQSSTNLSIELT